MIKYYCDNPECGVECGGEHYIKLIDSIYGEDGDLTFYLCKAHFEQWEKLTNGDIIKRLVKDD